MRAIARRLDLNFKTVRRYLRAGSVEALLAGGVRARANAMATSAACRPGLRLACRSVNPGTQGVGKVGSHGG